MSDDRELRRLLQTYRNLAVLGFAEKATAIFERLKPSHRRLRTMDRRIAAMALAHDATLLTRNLADFSKVPDLK
jgi:tRNA(fMet)-specific endonuclease VapC